MADGNKESIIGSNRPNTVRDAQRALFTYDFQHSEIAENSIIERHNEVALPDRLSCRRTLTRAQGQALRLFGLSLGLGGLFQPVALLSGLSIVLWFIFTALIIWRFALVIVGLRLRLRPRRQPAAIGAPNYAACPIYSVLVPVYDEAHMMKQLARALSALDWPRDKLDIQILLEADDTATQMAALRAGFPFGTRFTIIPTGGPRTKPNALNYGLSRAKGRLLCIYDVEDRPDCQQLSAAYEAFLRGSERLACVQAPLVASNMDRHLLSAHWGLEYATQFGLLLPAMAAFKLPIPIGGTSNHFRVDVLRRVGAWDAWNVTEDADLGLRLARYGLRVGAIAPPTLEDAPHRLSVWLSQRSRWIKGFMKTWLVLMRRPSRVGRDMGWREFMAMQLTLGGAVIAPLFHGVFLALIGLAMLRPDFSLGAAGCALLVFGLIVSVLSDVLAPGKWSVRRALAVLTRPLYWPLHSLAAYRALWELAVRPHFWAKTPHDIIEAQKETPCTTGSLP